MKKMKKMKKMIIYKNIINEKRDVIILWMS